MTLYKYKSLKENFEYTADILINNRLFASDFKNLNDPMEGAFASMPNVDEELKQAIRDEKSALKICSLSKSMKNPLLWTHYADEFRGICIELEISNDRPEIVKYLPNILKVYQDEDKQNAQLWAKNILTKKFKQWEYEDEYRVLTHEEYVKCTIKAIYLGVRISDKNKELLNRIVNKDIKFFETKINNKNMVVKSNKIIRINKVFTKLS